MNVDIQLTPHFHLKEFLHNGSPDGLTPDIIENLRALANKLEWVRAKLGNRTIHINSGFRTKQHNAEVGGEPNSQHLLGKAADIVVDGLKPRQVQDALSNWVGGLGAYKTFSHVDIGRNRRWIG